MKPMKLRKRHRKGEGEAKASNVGAENRSSAGAVELTFELPPSTNKLYATLRGGGKALTKVAHAYREGVKKEVVKNRLR